jgi:capsid protein
VAYHVRDGFNDEEYRRIPADQIIHVFEPTRPGEYRGLSFFAAVLNELHDLDDLHILEMLAAKDAAEKSTIYETVSGELDATAEGMRREKFGQATQNSSGTETTENKTRFAKQTLGGRVMAIKVGEKVTQFQSNRPTVTQQWYWDYLTGRICAGVGISKLLVYPYSMQGTVTRADLDVMAGFFRSRSEVLGGVFTEIRNYVLWWDIQNNVQLADPPSDWRKVTVRPPRSVNVDVGRNSSAMLAELKSGARTYEDVYAELGRDYRDQLRQRAKEAQLIHELAEEFEVSPGEIADFAANAIATAAATAQPQPSPDATTA